MEIALNFSYLNDLGLICSLGYDKESVLKNLYTQHSPLVAYSDDLVNTYVGKVDLDLPDLSRFDRHFQTRNNQLAYLSFQQINASLNRLLEQYPGSRIGGCDRYQYVRCL